MRQGSYAIVFADMDGTFLATDKSVPAANMTLLDDLLEQGVPFVPCTGRPIRAVPATVLAHPACHHAIGSNGAVVFDVDAGVPLRMTTLDKEAVRSLYERVRDLDVTFDVFCDGEVYAERARYEAMGTFGLDAPMLAMLRRVRKPTDLMVPELLERAASVEKVTCFWKGEADRDALVEALEATPHMTYAKGHPRDFEMQAPGASKGEALAWLCAYLDIDVADSVAFGDEGNDVTLLRSAGDGVAMANASEPVRAVADHFALSNDEAGVARYLRGDG